MIRRVVVAVLLLMAAVTMAAQSGTPGVFDLDHDREPMVKLDGAWRFHPGDEARWADPSVDDSHWAVLKGTGGWSSQGYAGRSGFAWYRAKLLIAAGAPPESLFIPAGALITNFQVFADGKLVSGCSWPMIMERVGRAQVSCPLTTKATADRQTLVLAIRVWHWPYLASYLPGGMLGGLRVGGATEIAEFAQRSIWNRAWQSAAAIDLLAVLYGLASLSAFVFYFLRSREGQYLWFGLYAMLYCGAYCLQTDLSFHDFRFLTRDIAGGLIIAAAGFAEIAFYMSLLGGRRGWLYWSAVAGTAAGVFVTVLGVAGWISVARWNELDLLASLPLYVWVVGLLVRRAVEGFPDARLLLAPAILGPLSWLVDYGFWIGQVLGGPAEPAWLKAPFGWPFPCTFTDLSDFIFLIAMMAILLLRFNRASTQGERLAAEMEAARTAQRVLVPEQIEPVVGYAIRSAYRPAGNLSGDFFQVLADTRGGALVVLGDVSGKGLSAAMTGTLAIGSLRALAATGAAPAVLLGELNRQLVAAKQGGFITLICARIAPDGAVVLANAGHLNPYRNGKEIATEPGLPLGIVAAAEYAETRLELAAGDTLTLLSDGVVEARTAGGELFGFHRTEAISGGTPEEIAETALQFGQDDDVTVLSITHTGDRVAETGAVPFDLAPAGA